MAQFTGTNEADTLSGAAENDQIMGLAGDDLLSGDLGDDTLQGGPGNDLLQGGDGADLLQHGGLSGADTLEGGAGDDVLTANNLIINNNPTYGDFAGSLFDGGAGVDYLQVAGPVTFRGELEDMEGLSLLPAFTTSANGIPVRAEAAVLSMRASDFDFNFNGDGVTVRGAGHVHLEIDPADNEAVDLSAVEFEAGANVTFEVMGSESNDTITGTSGDDGLDGEDGDDLLTGGGGADSFEISAGHDRITDFEKGVDKFDLSDFGFDSFESLQPYLTEVDGDSVLSITFGGQVYTTTFEGVIGLTGADFLFPGGPVESDATELADLVPGGSGSDLLAGLGGDDTLTAFAGDDTLLGGQGNDRLLAGEGADSLNGELGNDTLEGGADNDSLQGAGGNDLLQGGDGNDLLQNSGLSGVDTLEGGAGDDILVAMNLKVNGNPVYGTFADSVYDGGAGIDYLQIGGPVNFQGALEDMDGIAFVPAFSTLAGVNTISTDAPVLIMRASDFDFNFNGDGVTVRGNGHIHLNIDAADEDALDLSGLVRESGANVSIFIEGSAAADTVTASGGDDELHTGGGADVVNLGGGDDYVQVEGGSGTTVTLTLGAGRDTIEPATGFGGSIVINDFVAGAAGDEFDLEDFLEARASGWTEGSNPFTSGHLQLLQSGADTLLQFDADGGGDGFVTLATLKNLTTAQLTADNLDGFMPGGETDPATNDSLSGTAAGDTLSGGLGADTLDGGAGTDRLLGGDGDDLLLQDGPASGPETLDGGDGLDTLRVSSAFTNFSLPDGTPVYSAALMPASLLSIERLAFASTEGQRLQAIFGLNQFGGGKLAASLELIGGAGIDNVVVAVGGGGVFTMPQFQFTNWSSDDSVVLTGANGASFTLRANDNLGSRQLLLGADGADTLQGGARADYLAGNGGGDQLFGGADADTLDGGAGDDYLAGEDGDDVLTGGGGADVFEIAEGHDRITDFAKGTDKIDLSDYGFDGFASLLPNLSVVGGDTVLSIPFGGATHTLTIVGVTGLSAQDFLFPTEAVENEGTEAADLLPGGVGDDLLVGLGGDDTLAGFAGADTLQGGGGDDLLAPGGGADVIDGGAGVDRLTLAGATGVNVSLGLAGAQNTGAGAKTISNVEHLTGTSGSDTLTGDGAGNWLWGNGGAADSLNGGAGDDLLTVGAGGHTLVGGAGEDAAAFATPGAVNVSLAVVGAQNTGQGQMTLNGVERLSGSAQGDTLAGNATANLLAGGLGADSLNGGAGDDLILGDGAIDVVRPGLGGAIGVVNDLGQGFADTLAGGLGADSLIGGGGDDLLAGGLGNDSLAGGAGRDVATYQDATGAVAVDLTAGTATGADGADTLVSIEGVTGSAFADVLRGDDSANGVAGGLGADMLEGRGGADQLGGDAGADSLDGGSGDDSLSGGQGDDVLSGGLGADRLDGGAGFDRAAFSGSAAVTVDLNVTAAQDTGHGLDTLIGIEHVSGGTAGDRLTGDVASNWLAGGGGDDTLSGGGGDDLIQVGSGANVLAGDAGVDTLSFRDAAGGVSVSLADQGPGRDTLQGVMTFTGFENLSASEHGDTLTAGVAGGLLAGDRGADLLVGGAGADVLSGDGYVGVPEGGSGAIALIEGTQGGADTIDAGSGNDTVTGGAGDDLVLLNTQAGEAARVSLGAGADVLRLNAAMSGGLTVTDFQGGPAGDVLDMEAMLAARLTGWDSAAENPFETGHLRLVQDGAATVIEFDADGGGDSWSTLMRLENTSSLQLGAHNLGWAPLPMITGGAGADEFAWDPDSPADTVDGGDGVDSVSVTSPVVLVGTPTVKPSADGSALELDVDGDGVKDLTITGVEDLYFNGERVEISGDLSLTGLAPNTIHYAGTAAANLFDASGLTSAESVDVQGLGGADTLIGGLADDLLQGGDGDDTLSGGADNDTLDGGAGADTLDGGAGAADVARFSGDSTDYVVSDQGGGVLQVSGPDGVDRLSGVEVLAFANGTFRQNLAPSGANGSRTIVAGVAFTLAAGDFGFSDSQGDGLHAVKIATLPTTGELFLDLTPVTAGQVISADDIDAGRLVFLPDDDGSAAAFTFQVRDAGVVGWGANEDATANTLSFAIAGGGSSGGGSGGSSGGGGSSVITSGSSGTAGADVVSLGGSADRFAAGEGGDTVGSGAGDDWVHGNAGADSLSGGAGNDTLLGGRDNDRIFGDDGADQLFGDTGDDTVMGGQGDDRVEGGDGANYLRGEDGNDLVIGGFGFDNAHGNVGDDTVRGGGGDDWVLGGKNQDQLFGDAGNDILNGNLGSDTCSGGDGADIVRGGQADDLLDGGAGDDWLSGDLGDDTLTGGAGADVFNFFAGAGEDRVLDFSFAEGDRVQLARSQTYTTSQVGDDTVIDLSGGDRLVLANVQLSGLSDGWIVAA